MRRETEESPIPFTVRAAWSPEEPAEEFVYPLSANWDEDETWTEIHIVFGELMTFTDVPDDPGQWSITFDGVEVPIDHFDWNFSETLWIYIDAEEGHDEPINVNFLTPDDNFTSDAGVKVGIFEFLAVE